MTHWQNALLLATILVLAALPLSCERIETAECPIRAVWAHALKGEYDGVKASYLAKSVDRSLWNEAVETLILLMAPTAPHLAEELWEITGHTYSIHNQSFPIWDEQLAAEEQITLVIQINGKVRDKVTVAASIVEEEARNLALSSERIKSHVQDRNINKVIYVPQKLVNIVLN